MSGRGVIMNEPPQMCEMCGAIEECRPYGPNGEQVCFECASTKLDEKQVAKRMMKHIFGDEK